MSAEAMEDAAAPRRRRGMLGFYVAGFALVALALFGAWFWNAWTNWQFDEFEARRRQSEAARQLGVPVETAVDLGGGVTLELVLIPPGMFDMGSPDDLARFLPQERPLHRVRISRPFYMGKHEVTQAVWEKVTGKNPSFFKGARLPVESVYWDECQDFLQKLNARVGGKERFRLPTEAEWEWACRAGTKTRFSFGDEEARLAEYGWYFANSGNTTHPVGEKRPNAWGLYDCHGNVWEWCGDWGRTYSANPWPGIFRWTKDPQGRRTTTAPAPNVRGGAWDYGPGNCRSAFREVSQSDRTGHQGLRVAATTGRP